MQIRPSTLVWSAAGLLAIGTATGLSAPALLQSKDGPAGITKRQRVRALLNG